MFHVKRRPADRQAEWTAEALYAYGLRLLTFRARSERELRQRFQQRGAQPELIDGTIAHLRSGGLIDDRAFAQQWVESRRRSAPRGDRLLQQELARKGVPSEAIDQALSGSVDELALARTAAAKKARALAAEPEPAFVRKLTAFLLRRGFDYEVAGVVVRELSAGREAAGEDG
jgi:regulatory protein